MNYSKQNKFYKFGDLYINHQACHRLGVWNITCPLRCGFQICEEGHYNKNFVTPQYALVYILSGKGYYEDEHYGRVEVGPGCFVQRFPNVKHELRLNGYSASFFIAMPAEVVSLLQMTHGLASSEPVMKVGLLPTIVHDYLQMVNELQSRRDEELMEVAIKIQQVALRFHQLARRKLKPTSSVIDKAIGYLSKDFDKKIVLPELAEKLNLSYGAFRSQFLKNVGMPPGDFRILKRIELSQELLLEGNSVKETAANLNYPDAYTFSRQFKKVTGLPPSTFIKMNK